MNPLHVLCKDQLDARSSLLGIMVTLELSIYFSSYAVYILQGQKMHILTITVPREKIHATQMVIDL